MFRRAPPETDKELEPGFLIGVGYLHSILPAASRYKLSRYETVLPQAAVPPLVVFWRMSR